MMHTTVGLYPSGETISNGVDSENIASHVAYNVLSRPGRALFVDGKLIYPGINCEDEINKQRKNIKKIVIEKDTAPYH